MSATAFFERLLTEHGDSPRSLDWSPEGQGERFQVLTEVGLGMHGSISVLDVGCGLGHFFDYLREYILFDVDELRYRGLDASPAMVEAARRRVECAVGPQAARMFAVHDAVAEPIPDRADYVVASGVLNLPAGGGARENDVAMAALLRHCFEACRVACAVNMLSSRAPEKREGRVYRDPSWAIAEALRIAPRAALRHDYRPNDLTLYLYREPAR